jgi:hypothetical protein
MSTPAPEATAPEATAPEPTQPTTPAEPQAPAAPQAPAEAAAPAQPAAPEAAEQNADSLPQWARDAISKANAEAAKYRTSAKTAAEEAEKSFVEKLGKALGLIKEDEAPDPAKLTEQLTQKDARLRQTELELAIHKAAGAKKLNADELLDSRSFMERAQKADLSEPGAIAALLDEVAAGNSRFKVTQAAPQGGADLGPGGQSAPRIYTVEQLSDHDFYMKNRDDILAAQREGRIRS